MFVAVLYPYVYLLARVAFLEQSPSLAEAGRTLGLPAWRAFLRVNLPLARPAIAAGAALACMETLADFGTVSLLRRADLHHGHLPRLALDGRARRRGEALDDAARASWRCCSPRSAWPGGARASTRRPRRAGALRVRSARAAPGSRRARGLPRARSRSASRSRRPCSRGWRSQGGDEQFGARFATLAANSFFARRHHGRDRRGARRGDGLRRARLAKPPWPRR